MKRKVGTLISMPHAAVLLQMLILATAIHQSDAWLNIVFAFADAANIRGGRFTTIKRTRSDVAKMHEQLGDTHTRRAYRMTKKDFWKLVHLLSPHMGRKRNWGPKGVIKKSLAISATIRYCAGGSPCNIMLSHDLSHSCDLVWERPANFKPMAPGRFKCQRVRLKVGVVKFVSYHLPNSLDLIACVELLARISVVALHEVFLQ
jgi:hypothetical protein